MLSIGEFLKSKRELSGLTVRETSAILVKKEFRASEKTIYSWENNNSQPPIDAFLTMCDIYSIDDILHSLGYAKEKKISIFSQEEKTLVDNYRIAAEDVKTSIFNILKVFKNQSIKNATAEAKSLPPIIDINRTTTEVYRPLFDSPASAGTGVVLDEYVSSEMVLIPEDASPSVDFGIIISGESMTPNISDGATVWVKKYAGENLVNKQIYIVEINDQAFCKMFDGENFISINPNYSHLDFNESDTISVAGRVLYIENPLV